MIKMKNILGLFALSAILFSFTPNQLSTNPTVDAFSETEKIEWKDLTLEEAKKLSAETGKPIFVDISAVWCGYCKKMKRNVYSEESVAKTLNEKYIAIAIDGERGEGVNLVKKHKVRGHPTQFVFDSKGDVLKRNDGYMGESKLLSFLK